MLKKALSLSPNFGLKEPFPIIFQSEASECGLACLAMIATYHGQERDLASFRRSYPTSLKGLTFSDMMHIADDLGLSARPVRAELEALGALKTPCILHWDMRHFVVLERVQNRRLTIIDPSRGHLVMSMEEASAHFTGAAMELEPTTAFKPIKDVQRVRIRDFWQRMTGLKRSLAMLFVLAGLLQVFGLAMPLFSQFVVDHAIADGNFDLLTTLAIGFGLLVIVNAVTELVRNFVVIRLSNAMAFHMRGNLFHHLLRLPADYFEKRHIGDIITRFGSLAPIEQLLTSTLVTAVLDGLMAMTILVVIFLYSWQLSLVVLLLLLLNLIGTLGIFPMSRALNEKQIEANGVEQTRFLEIIRSITTIKAFGRESDREAVWKNTFANAINRGIRVSQVGILFSFGNSLLFGLGQVGILSFGALLVINGDFTVGMLFAFLSYQGQFVSRAQALIGNLFELKMLGLHLERLGDIVHATPEEEGSSSSKGAAILKGEIELENVSFRYAQHEPYIFENLDLKIEPGECVVIRGHSGSGKSTLLKIIMGLVKPTSGQVVFDGRPISSVSLRSARRQMGVVLQGDTLLSGTLADNIGFFDSSLDMDRVRHCANLAMIDDEIEKMPMGYESLIGDMGSALSGGQRQRVLLARALYNQPKILFLDEATSNIDPDTANDVMRHIEKEAMTRVIVTHEELPGFTPDRELWLNGNQLVDHGEHLRLKRKAYAAV